MNLEKFKKLNDIVAMGFMINDILKVLKEPEEIRRKIEGHYEKYPLLSWLAQKIVFYGWNNEVDD